MIYHHPLRNVPRTVLKYVCLTAIISSLTFCSQKKASRQETDKQITIVEETPLDQYVYEPDPAFRYEVVYQGKREGYTFYVCRMISQEWLTPQEVDEPEWWHWIKVVVPDTVRHATGFMWIGGGAKDDDLPEEPGEILMSAALTTGSVAAEIHNIPNQPLTFKNDPYGQRYEDEIIAFGWRKFLDGGAKEEDAIWLARLPMTKAVVRAMDVVTALTGDEIGRSTEQFVVAGGSKRGWTTWTTAAVDDRVIAIAPIVIDLLNIVPSFDHHWRNYGFWAPAVGNYVDEGIMEWMHSEEFARLLAFTEPYSYIERIDIPKLLINATGDQFFQPDSWQFYWDDLKGEKLLRYVPNAGHSLEGSDAIETLISFYQYVLDKEERPDVEWSIDGDRISITSDPSFPPSSIHLWYALSNEGPRDFRVDVIGKVWQDSILTVNPEGVYEIELQEPGEGWKACFVELIHEKQGKLPLKLTTGVKVIPEQYPFEAFSGSRD